MYRSEEFVADVIQSLLSLNYENLAVVAIDDCSPDATLEIARSYAASDPRLVVEGNASRLGMIGNWNRVLERAYELFPDFEYFAWASDNDFREPSWASNLTQALEDNPGAALAYCRFGTIEQDGTRSAGPLSLALRITGHRRPLQASPRDHQGHACGARSCTDSTGAKRSSARETCRRCCFPTFCFSRTSLSTGRSCKFPRSSGTAACVEQADRVAGNALRCSRIRPSRPSCRSRCNTRCGCYGRWCSGNDARLE